MELEYAWMKEGDLNELPRSAKKISSMIFVRNLNASSFELEVGEPSNNSDITRLILIDMDGGRRFFKPQNGERIFINVSGPKRWTGYEFHIVDIDKTGNIVEHLKFCVDASYA